MAPLTISQLNKLGERLRKGSDSKDDLLALDTFRFSFQEAIFTFSKAIAQFEEVEIALRKMPEGPGNKAAVEMAKAAMATFKKDLQTAIRGPIIRAEKAGDQ